MIRKSNIKNGNIHFDSGRGVALEDSEWLPMEFVPGYDRWRDLWWTVGNHGNNILEPNTLEPTTEEITVDFTNRKISVPWGTLRLDDIMRHMKKKPGVAWEYVLNPLHEDSLYRSARNGDKLTVFVFGPSKFSRTFDIEVREPTADANIVVPIDHPTIRLPGKTGMISSRVQNGMLGWPRVTRYESGIDTITGSGYGLAFDMRTDTLLRYLEKPANASWEFIWVDDIERPDLKDGDKLKVTSESGKVKEYYIQVQRPYPNPNANLSSITWPDIPEYYRGIFGWKGDTIPNFGEGTYNYKLEIPADIEGIPALKAKTANVNATVKVNRAKSLVGSMVDRTITFEVTAEDDTIQNNYQIELYQEKPRDKIEPFKADPFFSEFFNSYPTSNVFVEIYNPGNQPIDLRDYMISLGYVEDLYGAITYPTTMTEWQRRYTNYIPGLKYADEDSWKAGQVRMLKPDPMVNPIVPGNGTFVLARIATLQVSLADYQGLYDVQFENETVPGIPNPWGEKTAAHHWNGGMPFPPNGNRANSMFLYKVLNDSIKRGLKPNTDPNDFEIIDVWGMPNKEYWVIGDFTPTTNQQNLVFRRKPWVTKGNPELGGAFAPGDPEKCEWENILVNTIYSHIPVPQRYVTAFSSLHQHFMIEPTYYKSTVSSSVYKVSDGFGDDQLIKGLKSGVTVSEFLNFITKDDEGQTLKVISASDGSELSSNAVIKLDDKLVVVSADEQNTSIYNLDVTEIGLSNNAYLTSNRWNIQVTADPKSSSEANAENGTGFISGFDYGTTMQTVVDNITVPEGATVTIVDNNGAYVPFITLNFDTAYVSVTVNPDIFLDVVAENNTTRMIYQLQPNTSESDAFILSDVYEVTQADNLIHYVPRGTNFDSFLSNIIPSMGATVKLVDKMGFERKVGNIREDDKVVVTSANGEVTRVYFISFLQTAYILDNTYFAYVMSDAYSVDQVNYIITEGLEELTGQTMIDEFLGYITPSKGATLSIIDKNGVEKTDGDLDDGDMLYVTSADGKIITKYTLKLDLVSVDLNNNIHEFAIFPNPANDKLHIQGLKAENRIQIFNANGSILIDIVAENNSESIELKDIPSGLFLIVISDNNKIIGKFKALKK